MWTESKKTMQLIDQYLLWAERKNMMVKPKHMTIDTMNELNTFGVRTER